MNQREEKNMKRNNRRWKDILLGAVGMALVSCMVVPVLAYSGTRNEIGRASCRERV